jgi:predicted Zn-dependent peptidase
VTEIYRQRIPGGPDVVGYRLPGRTVTIGVLADAGSVHEPAALTGLSHVLSQAVFQRSGRRSREDLQLALEDSGLQRDCALNPEWTRYWVRGLSGDLHRALPLPVARQHIGLALPGPAYGDPDFYTGP